MARTMARVGTCVGLVQPGSLSLVHVEVARATRTLLASCIIVRLAEPTCAPLPAKWCIWWCCMVSKMFLLLRRSGVDSTICEAHVNQAGLQTRVGYAGCASASGTGCVCVLTA